MNTDIVFGKVVADIFRPESLDILKQRTAIINIETLETIANAKDWHPSSVTGLDKFRLPFKPSIRLVIPWPRLLQQVLTVKPGVNVLTARKYDTITELSYFNRCHIWIQNERYRADPGEHVRVFMANIDTFDVAAARRYMYPLIKARHDADNWFGFYCLHLPLV